MSRPMLTLNTKQKERPWKQFTTMILFSNLLIVLLQLTFQKNNISLVVSQKQGNQKLSQDILLYDCICFHDIKATQRVTGVCSLGFVRGSVSHGNSVGLQYEKYSSI
uniref:Transmembrane protein n=1 Tax=Spironucleus salmonicida TaxID=348837 RepID=V6LWX6_9EUKA|eukprot:EST48201.1 Hypothetical protein SS50377_11639 [Spironucleus salmonicida]